MVARQPQDSAYGRLLRRLDQALDMAHTRQWLSGYPELPSELELQGLSPEEMVLLQQILVAISTRTPLPGVTPAPGNGQQYC
ncbi:MAG: hypothetical protein VYB99_02220 [Pseudomonadota bacterium]|nr:hypothetical protein [Pseudomonadota bacterium]